MKERNFSIDFLKFLAAILITNSHMGILYGKYGFMSTGGCIGDVLFFFCSGFTLFLKPMEGIKQFPNWYKRRISRIYPSIIAVAIIIYFFFNIHWDVLDILIARKYWFLTCIMIYYIAIYFIGVYLKKWITWIAVFVAIGSAIWFYFVYQLPKFTLYANNYENGVNYVRWLLFFDFMLLGAFIGSVPKGKIICKPKKDLFLLVLSVLLFYIIFISTMKFKNVGYLQILSVLPLLSAVFYFYKVGLSPWAEKLYKNKVFYFIIRFVGGLCLEIYMIQYYLFTDKMNSIFPLNILIMFIIVITAAYLTRCFARLISQTFKDAPYNWKKMIALIE